MRQIKPFIARVSVFTISSIFALRLFAAPPSNTECQTSGGCSFPCTSGGGQSANLISASQLAQCSPSYMSNCPNSGSYGVCGVYYTYSAPNCDPAAIEDSNYDYNYYCSSN
jgi:hypothetical protein